MRGWVLSAAAHAAVVAATLIALPKPPPRAAPDSAVSIDVVDLADEANITPIAAPEAAPLEEAPPPEAAPELAEPPPELPPPARSPAAAQPPPPPPPSRRPPPPRTPSYLDAANRAAANAAAANTRGEPGAASRRGAGAQTALTTTEADRLRARIRSCFNLPPGLREPERLVVELRFGLNGAGQFTRRPEIVGPGNWRGDRQLVAVADAAIRAVNACAQRAPGYAGLVRPGREAAFADLIVDFGAVDR